MRTFKRSLSGPTPGREGFRHYRVYRASRAYRVYGFIVLIGFRVYKV